MPDETDVDVAIGATIETATTAALLEDGIKASEQNTASGERCSNCHTPLKGRHCYNCGQVADTFHRPIWSLFAEVLEGYLGLDGRIWRTIPPLLLRPGIMTARYLSGVRQPFMTPFRLFLLSSLLFFLVFTLATSGDRSISPQDIANIAEENSSETLDEAREAIDTVKEALQEDDRPGVDLLQASIETLDDELNREPDEDKAEPSKFTLTQKGLCALRASTLPEDPPNELCLAVQAENAQNQKEDDEESENANGKVFIPFEENGDGNSGASIDTNTINNVLSLDTRRFLVGNIEKAFNNPDQYKATLGRWAPRLVFVLAPAYGLLLALMFFWRRDIFIYDHMIVALHIHAFLFLFLALLIPLGFLIGFGLTSLIFLLWSNYYLYRLMRNVYTSGRTMAVLRVFLLDMIYLVLLSIAFSALLILGVVFV